MKTHFYTKEIIEACDNKHLTVDEIFEYVANKHPNAGKSSIYRNVEELSKEGLLKKVVGASKKTYFEKVKNDHIHLIDKDTGEIFDVDLENIASHLPIPEGFEMQDYDIKIYGKFRK